MGRLHLYSSLSANSDWFYQVILFSLQGVPAPFEVTRVIEKYKEDIEKCSIKLLAISTPGTEIYRHFLDQSIRETFSEEARERGVDYQTVRCSVRTSQLFSIHSSCVGIG